MARITNIINKEIDFNDIITWVDFGSGDGAVVKELKWNKTAKEKISIDKFPQNFGNDWKFVDEIDNILDKKRDLFTSFDCIEHLEKKDGENFIKKIDKYFKYKLFFTPRGFLRQDETTHPELMKINPWQKHLSGWEEDDFKNFGYKIKVLKNFHNPQGHNKMFDALIAYKID